MNGTERATPSSRLVVKLTKSASKSATVTAPTMRKTSDSAVHLHSALCGPAITKTMVDVARAMTA